MTFCHKKVMLLKIFDFNITGLVLILVISLPAFSQNVAPVISDPKLLEQTEQKKEEVFKQLFNDPTNLKLLFEYANLSILLGDLEGAIGVFEQMLIYDPKLPRIRLELGVLYFRLGAYALSENYLKSVGEYDPPASVMDKVEKFLIAIEDAKNPVSWQQNISLGSQYTTNGNSGINADFIEIGDFLLDVDPGAKRNGDRIKLFNYSLTINRKLNHPRGDSWDYFYSYGSSRLNKYTQFNIQTNVLSIRRNFNLDDHYFSFFALDDVTFSPNFNFLRLVLGRKEILQSQRLALDYSGITPRGNSLLISYYQERKEFPSTPGKTGKLSGLSYSSSFVPEKSQALLGFKMSAENYRANASYEFFENYLLELSYSQPLINNYTISAKYQYSRKLFDDEFPLFGAREDNNESFRFNILKSLGLCWSSNLGITLNDTRSSINIYQRRANNISLQFNYQCFK
tara:strand:+ start:11463 stop:12827 length:1365 start_codon:yes stop_codon:yes gene_type:complete